MEILVDQIRIGKFPASYPTPKPRGRKSVAIPIDARQEDGAPIFLYMVVPPHRAVIVTKGKSLESMFWEFVNMETEIVRVGDFPTLRIILEPLEDGDPFFSLSDIIHAAPRMKRIEKREFFNGNLENWAAQCKTAY